MKKNKNLYLILAILAFFMILGVVYLLSSSEEVESPTSEVILEDSGVSDIEISTTEDPIGEVIEGKEIPQLKVINDCLGSEVYSLNPIDILEHISDGKYTEKDLVTVTRNFHGLNNKKEKFMFSYKRLEFDKKDVYDLKVVKELEDGSVQSVEYDDSQDFEVVKKFFDIEEITIQEETKTFSGDKISLYYTQNGDQISELTIGLGDKVVACDRTENLNCLCR